LSPPRRPSPDRPVGDTEAIEPDEIFTSLDQILETQTEQSKSLANILNQLNECRKEHVIVIEKENVALQNLAVILDRLDGKKIQPGPNPFVPNTPSVINVNTGNDQQEKPTTWSDPKVLKSLSYLVFSVCLLIFLLLMFGVKMLTFGYGEKKGFIGTELNKPAVVAPVNP
jgi:hypothetical protein